MGRRGLGSCGLFSCFQPAAKEVLQGDIDDAITPQKNHQGVLEDIPRKGDVCTSAYVAKPLTTAEQRSDKAGPRLSAAQLVSAAQGKATVPARHASQHASMRHERMLRSVLSKAKQLAADAAGQHRSLLQALMAASAQAETAQANDSELLNLREQLEMACAGNSSPDASTLQRLQQLLSDVRRWLANASSVQAAVTTLEVLELALMRVEAVLQSSPVPAWSPDHVAAALALLQLYSALAQHATVPNQAAAQQLRKAMKNLLLARHFVLDLVLDMLQLVHFSQAYHSQCAAWHESLASALTLWDLLDALVRFAGIVVDPQALGSTGPAGKPDAAQAALLQAAVSKLAGLLAPGTGTVACLMEQPMTEQTAAAQVAAMQLLRHVFDVFGTHVLEVDGLAQHYVAFHFAEVTHHYETAGSDATNAHSDLCRMHLKVLRSMAASRSSSVRSAFKSIRVADWILGEFSLEATLLAAEQAEEASRMGRDEEELGTSDSCISSEDSGSNVPTGCGRPDRASDASGGRAQGAEAAHGSDGGAGEAGEGDGFKFTYDLNEDLERLMALEARLGRSVDLDGLEYDEEARRLMAREMPALLDSSTADADGETGAPSGAHGGQGRPRPARISLPPLSLDSARGGRTPSSGWTSHRSHVEGSRPSVPKLSLMSVRSAASSHVFTPMPSISKSAFSARSLAPSPLASSRTADGPSLAPLRAPIRPPLAGPVDAPTSPSPRPLPSIRTTHLHHSHMSPLSSRSHPSGPSPRSAEAASPTSHTYPDRSAVLHTQGSAAPNTAMGAEPSFTPEAFATLSPDPCQPCNHNSTTELEPRGVDAGRATPVLLAPNRASHPTVSFSGTVGRGAAAVAGGGGGSSARRSSGDSSSEGDSDEDEDATGEAFDQVPELRMRPSHTNIDVPNSSRSSGGSNRVVPALNLVAISSAQNCERHAGDGGSDNPSSIRVITTNGTIADSAADPRLQPRSFSLRSTADQVPISARPSYTEAVAAKLWHTDSALHVSLLQLLLDLLLTPAGTLDADLVHLFPTDAGRPNVEHIMAWHFTGPSGQAILPSVVRAVAARKQGARGRGGAAAPTPALRLLRLLSRQLFDPSRFRDLTFHSRGAYGGIYRAKLDEQVAAAALASQDRGGPAPPGPPPAPITQVMIKVIELPASGFDRCLLRDVYEEVAIMERYALHPLAPVQLLTPPADPPGSTPSSSRLNSSRPDSSGASSVRAGHAGICQVLDYGLTQDAYWIVMRRYRCSLAEWRARQQGGPGQPRAAAMYLATLLQVVDALAVLAEDAVVHFDLKAANVLVEPHAGVRDGQLWGPALPPPCDPPFSVVLADFGEARVYRNSEEAFTARNRGTEVYKSPEMLMMNFMSGGSLGMAAPPPSAPAAQATSARCEGADAGPSGVVSRTGANAAVAAALRKGGAGLASDVWSFGCLVFEVLTGRVLFSDTDYASVTHRVAFGGGRHLTLTADERSALGALSSAARSGYSGDAAAEGAGPSQGSIDSQQACVAFSDLVEWILVRDPASRPSLADIKARLQSLRADCLARA